jgi:hypothetical protein
VVSTKPLEERAALQRLPARALRAVIPAAALLAAAAPAGARAADQRAALLCTRAGGCPGEALALAEWADQRGLGLTSLEAVASAALAGGDAAAALRNARDPEEAARALTAVPLTLSRETLLALTLGLAEARLAGDPEGAEAALERAASCGGGQVHALPPVSEAVLARYLDRSTQPRPAAPLTIRAEPAGATIFVDGQPLGEAPLEVSLPAGWHRVSAEWPDRRAAAVAEVTLAPGGPAELSLRRPPVDHPAALAVELSGALRGQGLPSDTAAALSAWAGGAGPEQLLVVELRPAEDADRAEVAFVDSGGAPWAMAALEIDAAGWRPWSARRRAGLGWEIGAGQALLGDQQNLSASGGIWLEREGPDLELRLGVLRGGEGYYLYPDRVPTLLPTLAAGVATDRGRRAYAGLYALAAVPYALGGQLVGGLALSPAPGRRLALELQGGWTDQGPVAGAQLRAGLRRPGEQAL